MKNKPDFKSKPWPHISDSAKDFVKKLLVKSPSVRLTASQALCKQPFNILIQVIAVVNELESSSSSAHPWVRENGDASEIPLDISVLSNLRKFMTYNGLKQFALGVNTIDYFFFSSPKLNDICVLFVVHDLI